LPRRADQGEPAIHDRLVPKPEFGHQAGSQRLQGLDEDW
jgi:hypothetical protein